MTTPQETPAQPRPANPQVVVGYGWLPGNSRVECIELSTMDGNAVFLIPFDQIPGVIETMVSVLSDCLESDEEIEARRVESAQRRELSEPPGTPAT